MSIIEILEQVNPGADFENSGNFVEDGLLDSLAIMELISKLEEEYDVEFDLSEIYVEDFSSIEAIHSKINKIKNEQ